MNKLIIDKDKCIGCGICVTDCVRNILELKDGKANLVDNTCIGCGHCIAVCPTNAVRLDNLDMDEVIELPSGFTKVDPEDFLMTIKTSRSVRQFKANEIDKEVIEKILEAGRFTATAQNKQDVSYIVIDNLEKNREIEKLALDDYNRLKTVKDDKGNYVLGPYRYADFHEDFLFKKAPLLIMTKSTHALNAGLATKSMELMAEAMGLGVFHVGLFTIRANANEELKSVLDIQVGEELVTCLAIGYPNIEYKRTVPREKANINWI